MSAPTRGGRTHRTIVRALEHLRADEDALVVIVGANPRHTDHLRERVTRLTSTGIPARLRFATPESLPVHTFAAPGAIVVLWDHNAHEVVASRLADEEAALRARLEVVIDARAHHARIDVDHEGPST
jgi:sulfatase maturation enzyme AslB (radical SAM superfamily)